MASLRDRNVLITGGASGLGLGFAKALAAVGARVIIADINTEAGKVVENDLQAQNHKVKFLTVDVTSVASIASMLRAALAWLPSGETIDAAILSAGIAGGAFDMTSEDPAGLSNPEALETVERNGIVMNINLIAVVQTVQLLVKYCMGPQTVPSQDGKASATVKSITLIGSVASYSGHPKGTNYSAAKWGVRGAFRSLRQQLPNVGIRINMIAPGFVKTPLTEKTMPYYEKIGVRFTQESDVVDAVMMVTSDMACSGKAFAVTAVGTRELKDESAGMDGATVFSDLVQQGGLGNPDCVMGHDEQTVSFQ